MSDEGITAREATIDDLDVIVSYNVAMAREHDGVELDQVRLGMGVGAVLRDKNKGFFVVAEAKGRVVGEMQVRYEWSAWRNATFWWFENVYVVPESRRKGAYSAMHRFVLGEARSRDEVCGIRLYATADNEGARNTYRRVGMTGQLCEFFQIDFVLG